MLKIDIIESEKWDERTETFITTKAQTLTLEHSLVSISKWESKWKKPFLDNKNMTAEELLDYIKCMTLTQNVDPEVYMHLSVPDLQKINDYIHDPMTATWFSETEGHKGSREIITSEIVYYWMISLNIPIEFQKWHFNRLMALIRVCNEKNSPKKKMSRKEVLERNKALNEQRKRAMNTNG